MHLSSGRMIECDGKFDGKPVQKSTICMQQRGIFYCRVSSIELEYLLLIALTLTEKFRIILINFCRGRFGFAS